jgi:hypothetical protein
MDVKLMLLKPLQVCLQLHMKLAVPLRQLNHTILLIALTQLKLFKYHQQKIQQPPFTFRTSILQMQLVLGMMHQGQLQQLPIQHGELSVSLAMLNTTGHQVAWIRTSFLQMCLMIGTIK